MSIQTDDFAAPPSRRVVSAAPASPNEEAMERALRPKLLREYVGQAKTREQLEIFIGAAKKRGEALDQQLPRPIDLDRHLAQSMRDARRSPRGRHDRGLLR